LRKKSLDKIAVASAEAKSEKKKGQERREVL